MSPRVDLGFDPARIRGVRIRRAPRAGDPRAALVEHVRERTIAATEAACRERAAGELDQAVRLLGDLHAETRASVAKAAAELAFAIVRRLLYVEIDAGRYDLERMVRDTLHAAAAGRSPCVVHVHPDDALRLEGVAFRSGTTIESDIGVPKGSVHVETPMGLMVRELDALVDAVAGRIREELS